LNSSGTACLTEDFEQENSEAAKTRKMKSLIIFAVFMLLLKP